ncbi:hypothetical protein B0A48_11533 [Cryoendolithus antarcticus]|uniref:BZIP domain-containing protein n=1 Tax=Cryoendolithus antarcticus TaxID=1507870 RepID=A0A1V8SVS0_9PEZI|nr:hypothetical protein B0A48_11533 [Cryoendolithus antarcticus]
MSDSNDVVAESGDGDLDVDGKLDHVRDGTPSSMDSSPEPDAIGETTLEPTQPQKRKGGRKPIYATSEERKQRNRQAQAAFRERRTEYIKQLEATIKQNEDSLATLQQSHRSAADECLMLRYKNSLLERILLERGIDVQAELQMKTGTPAFPAGFMPPMSNIAPAPAPPLQRTALQRQHARRSGQALTPKLPIGPARQTTSPHAIDSVSTEQEYDTQHASHSMLDETEQDQSDGAAHLRQHNAYPPLHPYGTTSSGQQGFGYQHGHPSAMPPPGQQRTPLSQYEMQQGAQALSSLSGGGDGGAFGTLPHMIDPNDPMLDADPFGLSASMHYPTAYSFDPSGR